MLSIIAIVLSILIIFRLINLLKLMSTSDFWEGLAVHASFVLVIYAILDSSFLMHVSPTFAVNFLVLSPLWLVATYVFAKFEIDSKQKQLPKSKCFSLAVSRISIALIVFIVVNVILAIIQVFGEYVIHIQIPNELLFLVSTGILVWFGIIVENRKARFAFSVLLRVVCLGFLVYRLDHLGDAAQVDASDTEHHKSLLSDSNTLHEEYIHDDAYAKIDPSIKPFPDNFNHGLDTGHHESMLSDSNTLHEKYIHNDAYAKIDPSIKPFPDNFNHGLDHQAYAEQTPVTATTYNIGQDIHPHFNDQIRHNIQNSFGFSTATITESATHTTITDANGTNIYLYSDGSGGHTIQGPDKHYIGRLTAEGTIENAQSFTVGHIKHVGNNIALTDSMGMSVGHVDGTTGAILDQQGMTIGKVREGSK
ncbi:hypothetical protein AXX12_06320 [Anaerosporomusa subterranea]|uniref:Uncharacterized protein n=1 Tax=Anaerosporomusa subterranea TaxID=1794912 RepID=A0A154BQC4_ANASB|nr:hypothetical protein [Anaerosporomusa subterranea]KYZ76055.1 hypothetical protein AXX12_06320 [Anaerosporomusa subterranea]